MIEILSLIESFASHISAGNIESCIELVEKLIALAETLGKQDKPQ